MEGMMEDIIRILESYTFVEEGCFNSDEREGYYMDAHRVREIAEEIVKRWGGMEK